MSSKPQAHIQVYVSGALTGVRDVDDQKRFYEAVADVCRRHRLTPYLPHARTDPLTTPHLSPNPHLSPKQVYERNRTEILRSQLMLAYTGLPSLGVGAEVELANQYKIQVILLFERGRFVSRHVRGIPLVSAEIQFETREVALRELEACLKDKIGQLASQPLVRKI